MMNEFPQAFIKTHKAIGEINNATQTIAMNGSEYLNLLKVSGVKQNNLPTIQAKGQNKIWQKISGPETPLAIEEAIAELKDEDKSFSINGLSWTNDLSWENGYENVLELIKKLSINFHQTFDNLVLKKPLITKTPEYTEALLYLLLLETSCFRYWGQGIWTDYAKTIYERGKDHLEKLKIDKH